MALVSTKYNFQNIEIDNKHIKTSVNDATMIVVDTNEGNLISSVFFENILKAIHLEKGKNAYIVELDLEKNEFVNQAFLENGFSKLLLFGISPDQCGFNLYLKQFEIFQTENHLLVHYPSLEQIENNIELKKTLWGSLKSVYKID